MAQFSVTEVDGVRHTAAPRNEGRVVVEIVTEVVGGLSVCGQHIDTPYPRPGTKATPHTQRIMVYESELPAVEALVRTQEHKDALERCKVRNARDREAELRSAQDEHDRAKKIAEFGDKTYEYLHKEPGCEGGIPPLLSATVVRRGIAPPPTPEVLMANNNAGLASEFAAAMKMVMEDRRGGKGRSDAAG